jgi:chromosome segregation protein
MTGGTMECTVKPEEPFSNLFASGSRWLRADFHLHTESDGQFLAVPEGVSFKKRWVGRLEEKDIRLGIVANHNKFILDEYKTLRKEARKKGICILPGVELCVQGGKRGVHVLIVFDPESWVFNRENTDFINRFLDNAFSHVANRETDDAACDWTLSQALKKLEDHRNHRRDSFVVLVHVDDDKGVFKELGSGLRSHFNALFKASVLAVQKSRSRDNWNNLYQWVGDDWKPAMVEGSDCKSLETVGKAQVQGEGGKRCFIKLGAFSFQAVRLALLMKEQRISEAQPAPVSGYIGGMSFTGGLLGGQTLCFNPDMNNFIGIRGSGKSSILECLRYLLNIDVPHFDDNVDYKEGLVRQTLGSGGKVSVEVITGDKKTYRFERILGDSPLVSRDGEIIPNLRPQSLLKTRYFGQKELAKFSEKRFARDLVDRFAVQNSVKKEEIERLRHRIEQRLVAITQDKKHLAKIDEVKAELAEVEESLQKFEEENLQEKLKAQIALENYVKDGADIVSFQDDTIASLLRWLEDYESPIKKRMSRVSSQENEAFRAVVDGMKRFAASFDKLHGLLRELENARDDTKTAQNRLREFFDSKKEAFAEIRRTLKVEGDLNPDTYVELTKKKRILSAKLSELKNIESKRDKAQGELLKDLLSLQLLWHADFQERNQEVAKLNNSSDEISVKLDFKKDEAAFVEHLNALTSGIQRRTLDKVCSVFPDGVELYRDLSSDAERLKTEAGLNTGQIDRLRESLTEHPKSIITYCPPDTVKILYKGKPLHEHSIGQRATALMLFLLGQKDFDLLIIDQPEDDLDNQTIYTEVIKRLLDLKGQCQIIFATHSPNIPVLGDAERIFRCEFAPGGIRIVSGSIDNSAVQDEVVAVMEGGVDAFRKRQRIYEAWNH